MHVHLIAPERYVRASHDIVRHPRLKATAKTLLLWALSLPPGSRDTIQTIGGRMPEGRTAVSGARSQLIEEGYLHVRRAQHPTKGTWTTRTLISSVPLTAAEEVAAAWSAAGREDAAPSGGISAPSARKPAVGALRGRKVSTSPKGEKKRRNTSRPPAAQGGAPDLSGVPSGQVAAAAKLLCSLAAPDARLASLGLTEAVGLAPLVAQWLERDRSVDRLRAALLSGLPERVHAPAALLRTRLDRKMPPVPVAVVVKPVHECAQCAAPVPQPGVCRRCAGSAPAPGPDRAAVARTRGGVALARRAMWGSGRDEAPRAGADAASAAVPVC